MSIANVRIFGLAGSAEMAAGIAASLGLELAPHEERDFEDGEHKARPLVSVRGFDTYVVHSLFGDEAQSANDKFCRLLFFCGACRDAGARSVTAVVPYLCYARKDRKTKARDPVMTRYIAQIIESVGIDRVIALEVHNPVAFQNAFRCSAEHLDCYRLFADRIRLSRSGDFVVISPDTGGIKRAAAFRRILAARCGQEIGSAFVEKYRSRGEVTGGRLVGEVSGRTALILDDLIATGGTMLRAANAALENGAARVYAIATHGLFAGQANRVFSEPAFEKILIANSIPPFRLTDSLARSRLEIIDIAPLVGETIRRLETGESLVELLDIET